MPASDRTPMHEALIRAGMKYVGAADAARVEKALAEMGAHVVLLPQKAFTVTVTDADGSSKAMEAFGQSVEDVQSRITVTEGSWAGSRAGSNNTETY